MGLRRRELALGSAVRRLRGPTGVPGTTPTSGGGGGPGGDILTITDNPAADGVAMVTCSAPHGLTVDVTPVTVSGSSVGAYNGSHFVFPSLDTFDTADPMTQFVLREAGGGWVAHAGDATGGTWTSP